VKTRRPVFIVALLSLLLILMPAISAAQTPVSATPGTITVTGEGTASVPAEQALVVITLGTDGSMIYDPATGMPNPDATPTTVNHTAVIDAMVAHGIPADAIEVSQTPFMGDWGPVPMPQPVMLVVTIPDPTVEGLTDLLTVVRDAASAEGIFVNQFGVMYSVADCRPVRQEARANAVADARMEAEDQATAMETSVGDAVASKDTMPMVMGAYQPNSCTTGFTVKPVDTLYMAAGFDPRLPAEVTVTLAVEVTFEIP
jgi:uncharacterized protein YggE